MTPYEVLGVRPGAGADEIRAAYRRLAKQLHPDVNKDPDAGARMAAVNVAFEALTKGTEFQGETPAGGRQARRDAAHTVEEPEPPTWAESYRQFALNRHQDAAYEQLRVELGGEGEPDPFNLAKSKTKPTIEWALVSSLWNQAIANQRNARMVFDPRLAYVTVLTRYRAIVASDREDLDHWVNAAGQLVRIEHLTRNEIESELERLYRDRANVEPILRRSERDDADRYWAIRPLVEKFLKPSPRTEKWRKDLDTIERNIAVLENARKNRIESKA